jgi:hypothetical protein
MLGTALSWPDLDVDLYVPGAHKGRLRNEEVDRNWVGPVAASESKAHAQVARENGVRGGRPKKYTTVKLEGYKDRTGEFVRAAPKKKAVSFLEHLHSTLLIPSGRGTTVTCRRNPATAFR